MIEFRKLAIDFRHKWLTKIHNDKSTVLPFQIDGMNRQIFLIPNSTSWINQFLAERSELEKLFKLPINGRRSPNSWLPQCIQNCHSIRVKAYPAVSSRKISKIQAREFAKKAGVVLPAGGEHFRLRTSTGTKLMLAACVDSDSRLVTKFVPFSEWCVVLTASTVSICSFSTSVDLPKKTKQRVSDDCSKVDQTDYPIASFGRSKLYLRQPNYEETTNLHRQKDDSDIFHYDPNFKLLDFNIELIDSDRDELRKRKNPRRRQR